MTSKEIQNADMIFEDGCGEDDIHQLNLNVLGGERVNDGLRDKLEGIDLCFLESGSYTKEDKYVFRGIKIDKIDDLILDSESIVFATWSLDKEMRYFSSPAYS